MTRQEPASPLQPRQRGVAADLRSRFAQICSSTVVLDMASDEHKPLTDERPDYNAVFGVSGREKTVSTSTIFGRINHVSIALPTHIMLLDLPSLPHTHTQISDCRRFLVEWIFLGFSLLAFLGSLGISIERLVHFSLNFTAASSENESGLRDCEQWTCSSDYTFTVVLIINICEWM